MEIKGRPGEEVWVKAKIHLITITEAGITYYVKMDGSGQSFEMKEGDIMAAAPKIIREPAKREEPQEEPEEKPENPAGVIGDDATFIPEPRKKRGRPRKATVEDLMRRSNASNYEI